MNNLPRELNSRILEEFATPGDDNDCKDKYGVAPMVLRSLSRVNWTWNTIVRDTKTLWTHIEPRIEKDTLPEDIASHMMHQFAAYDTLSAGLPLHVRFDHEHILILHTYLQKLSHRWDSVHVIEGYDPVWRQKRDAYFSERAMTLFPCTSPTLATPAQAFSFMAAFIPDCKHLTVTLRGERALRATRAEYTRLYLPMPPTLTSLHLHGPGLLEWPSPEVMLETCAATLEHLQLGIAGRWTPRSITLPKLRILHLHESNTFDPVNLRMPVVEVIWLDRAHGASASNSAEWLRRGLADGRISPQFLRHLKLCNIRIECQRDFAEIVAHTVNVKRVTLIYEWDDPDRQVSPWCDRFVNGLADTTLGVRLPELETLVVVRRSKFLTGGSTRTALCKLLGGTNRPRHLALLITNVNLYPGAEGWCRDIDRPLQLKEGRVTTEARPY